MLFCEAARQGSNLPASRLSKSGDAGRKQNFFPFDFATWGRFTNFASQKCLSFQNGAFAGARERADGLSGLLEVLPQSI